MPDRYLDVTPPTRTRHLDTTRHVRGFRQAFIIGGVALAYFLFHLVAFLFPDAGQVIMAVWPAAGIGLAALLLSPMRRWPALVAACYVAGVTADVAFAARPFIASVGYMTGNMVESLGCAWLVFRWGGRHVRFNRTQEVFALITGAVFVNAASACIGAATAVLSRDVAFVDSWLSWYVADGLGILIITPLIITWLGVFRTGVGKGERRASESTVFLLIWSGVAWVSLSPVDMSHPFASHPYMLMALLVWPALRLGQHVVSLALVLLAVLSVSNLLVHTGPFPLGGETLPDRLLQVQAFLMFAAFSGFVLAAVHAESTSAERVAREEQTRLTALGDNLPNGMVYQVVREHDGGMRFEYVSAGIQRITGVTVKDALRDPTSLYGLIVEEDRERVVAAEAESAKNMSVFRAVGRFKLPDGPIRWMQLASSPRRLADGRLLWDGVLVDVTDLKLAEEAQRQSEERLTLAMKATHDAVWDWDLLANTMYYSPTWWHMLGLEVNTQETDPGFWRRLTHPEDVERAGQVVGAAVEGEPSFEVEVRVLHRDGHYVPILTRGYVQRDASGTAIRVSGTNADLTERRRAEAAVQESEARFHVLANSAPVLIWITGVDNLTDWVNQPFLDFVGQIRARTTGTGWMDSVHPDDSAACLRAYREAFEARVPFSTEFRLRRADGVYRWILDHGVPRFDSAGTFLGYIGSGVDITEQKLTRDELARVTREQRIILEHANVGITLVRDRVVLWANRRMAELFGYTPSEMTGQSTRLFHLSQAAYDEQGREAYPVLAEGRSFRAELEMMRRDGSPFWAGICGKAIDPADTAAGTIWIFEDMSERKEMELRLRASEEKFRATFMTSPDACYLGTLGDGVILDINQGFERLFGYTSEEAVGKTSRELNLWVDQAARDRMIADLRSQGVVSEMEVRGRKKNGEIFVGLISTTTLSIDGRPSTMGIIRDITDRQRAEEEKAKLEADLRQAQKMETVGRLAGGVAHDFNNMLGIILGHVDLAMEEVDAALPLYTDLVEIRTAAKRSADLTRQLLAFARKQTIAPKVVDLNEAVTGMLKMLQRLIGEDIALAWQPGADLWPVKVDPSQIDQILTTLSVNARDAISDVGKISIETGNSVLDEEYCADHLECAPGEYVRLVVSDDGCGMDQETQAHLFEPFFTTKEMGKGTGMGLAMVYGAVKQNGGFLSVYSEPGRGTRFAIYLRRHHDSTEQRHVAGARGSAVDGHDTILLVEDESSILTLAVTMLERHGYTVLAASTPGEAIRLAQLHAGKIHLLVTDVVMPEMNGWDLSKKVKSFNPRLNSLFMSGYTANVIAHRGVLDDGVHFIQKPFSGKELAARVRAALPTMS